ncbi:MAG: hypothetical protein GX811_04215 [Lentisphaerae bacterium]|nr:hypothetical protein [Lentisphaerota bacterium]
MVQMQKESAYPTEPIVNKPGLPDPFLKSSGARVANVGEWEEQAEFWRNLVMDMEYGGLPPTPTRIEVELLARAGVRRFDGEPNFWSYRITAYGGSRPISFCVQILFPKGEGPFPAIINGDGCWWYMTDEIAQSVMSSGCALVMFNRTEIVEDRGSTAVTELSKKVGGLY